MLHCFIKLFSRWTSHFPLLYTENHTEITAENLWPRRGAYQPGKT